MSLVYKKRVSALDVAKLLQAKGVKPSQIIIEEDGDEVRITVVDYVLTEADKTAIDELMKRRAYENVAKEKM